MTNPHKPVEARVRQIIAGLPEEFTTAQILAKYPGASPHSIAGVIKRLIYRGEIRKTGRRVHIERVKTTYSVYRRTSSFTAEIPSQRPKMDGCALSKIWVMGGLNQGVA